MCLENGRGERSSPATNDLPITMRLAEPPTPFELVGVFAAVLVAGSE